MGKTQELAAALAQTVGEFLPDSQGIRDLVRLSGGASQETWAFEALDRDGNPQALILRRAPGGHVEARNSQAIGLRKEAELIKAASQQNVPVPDIAHICSPSDGLGDAFIMGRLEGETIARKILRDSVFAMARDRLAEQCGRALAGIHACPIAGLPDMPRPAAKDQISQYETIYRDISPPRPVIELAFHYLKTSLPPEGTPVLVHGDFRLGNLMVDSDGLAGVLDWELAHLGDPREDIAWMCVNSWRFGQSHKRVGGFGDLDVLLDAYSAAGGAQIRPQDIDWWEILGTLKWGVMCMMMYESFRTGAEPTVERAAIGRRVSETEIDLITLLEKV